MNDFFCLELKFKNPTISREKFHSHLFMEESEMYFRIYVNENNCSVDRKFFMAENSLGLFEENFEVIDSDVLIIFDNSRIYKGSSLKTDNDGQQYFTIFVSKIWLVLENKSKDNLNEGVVFLNENGLSVVNLFYSFFTNLENKNVFSISRMNGMNEFYRLDNKMKFRPELEFYNNEKKGSKEFTIKKIPTINFIFNEIQYFDVKKRLQIVCSFLSFCFGVKIIIEKIVFRTEKEVYIFRDNEPNNRTYVSNLNYNFRYLEKNFNIQKILKTDWFNYYNNNETSLTKSIDNFLHAREVDLSSSFLLLFNIIEIFNINKKQEKFTFKVEKKQLKAEIFSHLKSFLSDKEEEVEFDKKVESLVNKLEFKPFKSPLEETLQNNNIDPIKFGFTFNKLKQTRDSITHGSLNSIKEEELKLRVYCLRKIVICLIFSKLGFKDDFKTS